jgi:hypothetical protein
VFNTVQLVLQELLKVLLGGAGDRASQLYGWFGYKIT